MPISSSTTRMLAMAIGPIGPAGLPGRPGAADAIDQLDPGVMLVDDFLHHGKSKACPARLGGHVGLERAPKYIRREPGPIVLDRKTHGARGRGGSGPGAID